MMYLGTHALYCNCCLTVYTVADEEDSEYIHGRQCPAPECVGNLWYPFEEIDVWDPRMGDEARRTVGSYCYDGNPVKV